METSIRNRALFLIVFILFSLFISSLSFGADKTVNKLVKEYLETGFHTNGEPSLPYETAMCDVGNFCWAYEARMADRINNRPILPTRLLPNLAEPLCAWRSHRSSLLLPTRMVQNLPIRRNDRLIQPFSTLQTNLWHPP